MTTLGMLLWEKVTLDVDLVVRIFIEVCELLEETHSHGYAVGTLHPEGIVIVRGGEKLTSVHIKKSGLPCAIAYTDEISLPFDKANYLSPEQLDGLAPSPRSDIYAIGCMMFTALTGTPPFSSKSTKKLSLISANTQLEFVYEHKIAFLETVIKRCLKDDESKRYRSVGELKLALQGVLAGVKPPKRTRKIFPLRAKAFIASFVIGLLAIFCVASLSTKLLLNEPESKEPVIQGFWNSAQYEYGDQFSILVTTKRKCHAYVFYVDDEDSIISLYPSRGQGNNIIAAGTPLQIGTVENNAMLVDETVGKIILVSITADGGEEANKLLLRKNDWIAGLPNNHCLGISGKELLNRIEQIKATHPDVVDYSVDPAPRAPKASAKSKFPARVEIPVNDPAWD